MTVIFEAPRLSARRPPAAPNIMNGIVSILPVTFSFYALVIAVEAYATLFALYPTAFILSAILPNKSSFTMPFIFLKFSNVLLSIRPNQMTMSMHFVV
jgi:hypothetical protein